MRFLRLARAALAVVFTASAVYATDPAVPAESDAPRPGAGYPGALFLFEMKAVTVVYPAGPGLDVAANRRSAEARARFLESVHGVAARVASDRAVTEADLRGHLLVLGWENALMRPPRAPRAFEHRGGEIVLLGEVVGEPGDDLLLFNRSPFAENRYMAFWSRIDAERDRFMVLPRVGSDWAVIRDFRTARQGMFVPEGGWPPVRDPQAEGNHEARLLEVEGRYTTLTSPHFIVHYESERIPQAEIQAIVKIREEAYAKAVTALGAPRTGFRIHLWVHDDEGAKKDLTGVDDVVHTLGREAEIHMTRRAARSSSAREETKVVARARIGPAYVTALYEGLGVAVDGTWRGRDLDLESALMTEAGNLPPLADLLDEERFRQLVDGPGMPAAGSFVAWVRATRPAAAFARVYGLADASILEVARTLGLSAADLEAGYRGWVAERGALRGNDVIVVKAEAEAKSRLAAGDFAGVATALERAHAAKPRDPQILFNLASALMRTPRLEDAEATFRKVLALPLGAGESRFRIFSLYQIGRILDIGGRREEALDAYAKVLALPDEYDAHRLARERVASPATREHLE